MAFVVKDRVKQSTTTTGTGSIVLNGTVSGFQTFTNALSDGDTTYYAIFEVSTNEWEVGVGTWTESTTTLARTTVLASSNSNSAIDLSAQAEVFITQPAGKAAFFDPSGDLTLVQDPTSNLQAATKQYVDTIAAAGLHYHDPVRVEQEGNLSATYSNGTAGVGATLTNNSTQAALTIDGVALSLNDRVLIYEQTNGYENGIYTVTNVGSASTNWVLTRATDADSYAPSDPDSLGQGDAFFVLEGTAGAGELYVMNTEGTITFGTTNITFTQVAATAVYTAGTGLTLTGTEFAADGANITNVDAVTLDGIDSSQFLRSDVVDTKTAGNLNFSDNVKAQFGTGNDLQIYHDGSNSEIINTSSGHFLLGSASRIILAKNPFEYMANFQSDGAATLYYDNAAKFATSSTGISVTGTVNVPFKSVSTYTVSGINGGAVDTNGGDIVTGRIFFTGSSDSGTELFGFNNESTGLTLYNYVDGHYALYVANSNNIGLGTSTPGGKLEVNSNSSFPIIRARYNSSYYTDYNSNGITYNGSGQTFNFIDNGSTKVTIASGGNVGIGITSPTAALHVAKSSGNTIINLQRTNANTTGSVGTIQFSASDDHAVASIAAFGDGDDEGAYLSFRTTSSATTNSWYTGTDEAMRIDSNRDIRFYNDSGNVNLFWDASTMALGIGTGTTTPTNPITIQQTSVHWPYIALTNSSGVTKSQFGYQVNDDLLDIVANSGGIKFRTAGSERMRITSTGLVGINETAPQSGLHVKGSGSSSWITVENTLAGNYSIVDFLNNSGTRVGYIGTYNNDNALYFYGAQAGPIQFFTNNSEAMRIDSSGRVGIGTSSPSEKFNVYGTNLKPVIGEKTAHTVLYSGYDGQNNTALEISASGTGTSVTNLVLNNPNVSAGGSYHGVVFSSSGTSSSEKRMASIGANLESAGTTSLTGYLGFYTSSAGTLGERLRITSGGYVGIGTASPTNVLHIYNTTARVKIENPNADEAHIELKNASGSVFIGAAGAANEMLVGSAAGDMVIGNRMGGKILISADSGYTQHHISIAETGDITLSNTATFTDTSTNVKLSMTGNAGASSYNYFLNASNDGGNRAVHFVNGTTRTADGGANTYTIRNDGGTLRLGRSGYTTEIEGNAVVNSATTINFSGSHAGDKIDLTSNNAHNIGTESYHNTYGPQSGAWNSGTIGHKFFSNNGNVIAQIGVGGSTTNLTSNFYGDVSISGSGSTMAGATMANANLLIGTTTSGIGIDSNEIIAAGDNLYLGGLTNGVVFRVGANQHGAMDSSGNFGFGTTTPSQKLHVQGGQVRVSNGSDFYINSTSSNSYVYTSSTPFDIYTAGTMRMRVGSTGDVSIGNNAAFTIGGSAKLTVLGASGTVYLAGGSTNGDQFYLRKNASVTGMYEWQTYYSSNNAGTIQLQPYGGSVTIGGSNATTTKQLEVFGDIGSTGLTVVPTGATGGAYFGNATQTSYMNLIITSNSGNAQIWKSGTGYSGYGGTSSLNIYNSNANIAFFSNARSTADMNITNGNVSVAGALTATTKSFVIDHPTKEGMKLRYGSLEGPEDGVYVRGRLAGETVIELPDYWTGLVHEDSITVQLTAMGGKADLWVESIADNKVTVGCDTEIDCFYFVQATRKDVDAWEVEYVADS